MNVAVGSPRNVTSLPAASTAIHNIAKNAYLAGRNEALRIVETRARIAWRELHMSRTLARESSVPSLREAMAGDAGELAHLLRALLALRRELTLVGGRR